MAVRRVVARRKWRTCHDIWPINEAAGQRPKGWTGWPNGKKFAFVLTHDVEGPKGLSKCRQLMHLEQELGFYSSFNFIPEGDYMVSRELREELNRNGFEVGIHDLRHDGKLYWTRRDFSESAVQINRYLKEWEARGFRSGFMHHNLDWVHDLEIKYDASTFDTDPFEPQPDGVNTIFPFWVVKNHSAPASSAKLASPFTSRNSSCAGGYVELPYTLPQDSTLFLVLRETTTEIWKKKLDWIVKKGGMALLNVHPDYLAFDGNASNSEFSCSLYRELLEYVQTRYAGLYWQPLPRDMAEFVSTSVQETPSLFGQNRMSIQTAFDRESQPVLVEADVNGHGSSVGATGKSITLTSDSSINNGVVLPFTPSPLSIQPDQKAAAVPRLAGRRVGVVLFSHYPSDPRPRRAAEALVQEGAEVDFFCLQREHEEPRHEIVNGLEVFRVPLKRRRSGQLVYLLQYGFFISNAFLFLTWRCLRRRYHLIHVHNMPDVLVFSALIPKWLGAKVILDLHDPMPELMTTIFKMPEQSFYVRLLKWTERWSIRFADLILTPNIAFKKLFASRSCSPDKIEIVMNSPNENVFQFKPATVDALSRKSADPFVILYHGSLVHRHGLDLAIDALAKVRMTVPQAVITICGESTPYFEQVMASVKSRGLSEAVRYLGLCNRHQIMEAIDGCHLGIIPNRRSIFTEINMPTRIFEYLARAKPVIAPRTLGIQDYFTEQDILFFDPDNIGDLAAKILWAVQHPEELIERIQRGQAIYRKNRWSQEREKLVVATVNLLAGHGGSL